MVNEDMMTECYKVLGLKLGAEEKDVKKAYRQLSRKLHPDMSRDITTSGEFIKVTAAYNKLLSYISELKENPMVFDESHELSESEEFTVFEAQTKKRKPSLSIEEGIAKCCENTLEFVIYSEATVHNLESAYCLLCGTTYIQKNGKLKYSIEQDGKEQCLKCGNKLQYYQKTYVPPKKNLAGKVIRKVSILWRLKEDIEYEEELEKEVRIEMVPWCSKCEKKVRYTTEMKS